MFSGGLHNYLSSPDSYESPLRWVLTQLSSVFLGLLLARPYESLLLHATPIGSCKLQSKTDETKLVRQPLLIFEDRCDSMSLAALLATPPDLNTKPEGWE